jgi:hypothetical protein
MRVVPTDAIQSKTHDDNAGGLRPMSMMGEVSLYLTSFLYLTSLLYLNRVSAPCRHPSATQQAFHPDPQTMGARLERQQVSSK